MNASNPYPATSTKAGWRPNEWARDVGCSRAYVYLMLGQKRIDSVVVGRMRVILTTPSQFLASLAAQADD
jgi:hypothetical protein